MHKKLVIIISLIFVVISMSIGYAIYSTSLNVKGTGSIDSTWDIEVTNIKENKKEGKAISITNPTYTKSTATFNTKLSRPGDNIEYEVELSNRGSIDGKIENIIVTNPNNLIKVETRGISKGQILKSGEVKTYIVRVYIPDDVKVTEDVTSKIEVNTEITQDDNQIFNEPIDGVEANKVEIISTIEESDYTSIDVSVNAKGKGLKYYYSLDGKTWTNESTSNTYTFNNLEPGKRYTVYYKVEDENNNYVIESKWVETKFKGNYIITYNYNGATSENEEINKTINYGDKYGTLPNPKRKYTLTYNYNNGEKSETKEIVYPFLGWYKDSEYKKSIGQDSIYEFKKDSEIYAKWDIKSITLPISQKEGYSFKGWYSDENFENKIGDGGEQYTVKENLTLYAKFVDDISPSIEVTEPSSNYVISDKININMSDKGTMLESYAIIETIGEPSESDWIEIKEKNLNDTAIKKEHGALWARVFYHNNKSGTVLFSSDEEALHVNTEDKYSILNDLESFRDKDGKFEFLLEYPNSVSGYNRWKQSDNPTTTIVSDGTGSETANGYEAVHIDWTGNYWGGLTKSTSTSTFIDGSVGHSNWYYAIGSKNAWNDGIPGPNDKSIYTEAELWVRIDDLNKTLKKEEQITIVSHESKTCYIWVKDKAGNKNSKSINVNKVDSLKPEISLSPNSQSTFVTSKDVAVNITDNESGLAANQKIYYAWSTSNTSAPSFSSYVTTTNAAGATSTTVTVPASSSSSLTGTYYLWIQTGSAVDMVGHKSNQVISGAFKFDNTKPTISLNPNTQASYVKSKAVTVNLSDTGSGLVANQKIYYAWSTSNTSAPSFSSYLTTTNAAGATSTAVTVPASSNSSLTGTYYLWIKAGTLADVFGHTSNQVVSGAFKFDNTLPSGAITFTGTKGSVASDTNVYIFGTSIGSAPYASSSSVTDGHSGVKSSSLTCSSGNTAVATVSNASTSKVNVTINSRKGTANSYHYLQEKTAVTCKLSITDNAGNTKSVSSSANFGNGWYGVFGCPNEWWNYINGMKKMTGWIYTYWYKTDSTVYYYMNSSGSMLKGWQKIGGYWYYLKDDCSNGYKAKSGYDYPSGGMFWSDTLIRTSDNAQWTFDKNGHCISGSGC